MIAKPVKLMPKEPIDVEPDQRPKRSRLSRVAGKIPLLRRLKRH